MRKVDIIAALDMHVERGEWEKCIQTAEQEVGTETRREGAHFN